MSIFHFVDVWSVLGIILSAVDLSISKNCSDDLSDFCDSQLVTNLKIVNLCVYILAFIYTTATVIVIVKTRKNPALTQTVLRH